MTDAFASSPGHHHRATPAGLRTALRVAAGAVCFAAADTYVVVLALPDMMIAAGVPVDDLQRAAPIISGFLLGYVALLPLAGRLADLHGRRTVLLHALLLFAVGSFVTACSYDLTSMVAGRFLQGLGAGALVPATLALVADLYPPERRGVPLGWVGAAQEVGSVLGPLLGALVLTIGDWRDIFWLNLGVGLLLAFLLRMSPRAPAGNPVLSALDRAISHRDAVRSQALRLVQLVVMPLAAVALALATLRPDRLVESVSWGGPFVGWGESVTGSARWWSPIGVAAIVLAAAVLVSLRPWRWVRSLHGAGVLSATLIAVALGGVVLAFAGSDPEHDVVSQNGWVWLTLATFALIAFGVHERFGRVRLIPAGTFGTVPAWGALLVSLLTGAALVAAVVDVPLAARLSIHPDSQLGAALLLLRFLIAVPIGAVVGGRLTHRWRAGDLTAVGMTLATIGFIWMASWDAETIGHWSATIPLVVAGFGFGLVIAPVNASMLVATASRVHGLASGMLVVARMIGMLVGLSILTAIGLNRFYAATAALPSLPDVCGGGGRCAAYDDLLQAAAMSQVQAVFTGAAFCAAVAALVGLATLRAPSSSAAGVRA